MTRKQKWTVDMRKMSICSILVKNFKNPELIAGGVKKPEACFFVVVVKLVDENASNREK